MTCPQPTPGSVSNQSGFLTLVGGHCDKTGAVFQWQYLVLLSDKVNSGLRYQQNKIVQHEKWLMLTVVGFHCVPGSPGTADSANLAATPNPPVPLTLQVGVPVEAPPGSGNAYTLSPRYTPHSGTCRANGGSDATSGALNLTRMDEDAVEGTYTNVAFAAGTCSGTFAVTRAGLSGSVGVSGCPTRPTKSTCVSA